MKITNGLWFIALILISQGVWAYGGGGGSSTKACAKPKFSNFSPAENAEARAGSAFSFSASKNTYANTIKVTVKGQPVNVNISSKNDGTHMVSGRLPDSIKGPYARIAISADAQSNCNGSGGWLVNIAD
jgi:hypothetical protein